MEGSGWSDEAHRLPTKSRLGRVTRQKHWLYVTVHTVGRGKESDAKLELGVTLLVEFYRQLHMQVCATGAQRAINEA